MEKLRFVGLDVHVDSIAISVAEQGGGEPSLLGVFPHDVASLVKRLRCIGATKCCYEAGPTGFGLQRALSEAGLECVVVAPSLVPSRAGDHVKTDRRDAARFARSLRSGDLTEIYVPDSETEALRDLERARDDAKKAERVARHQLGKFLVRHGRCFPGKTSWTRAHLDWARSPLRLDLSQRRRTATTGSQRLERAGLPISAENPIYGRRTDPDELGYLVVGVPLLAEANDGAANLRGRRWSHAHRRSRPAVRIKWVRR